MSSLPVFIKDVISKSVSDDGRIRVRLGLWEVYLKCGEKLKFIIVPPPPFPIRDTVRPRPPAQFPIRHICGCTVITPDRGPLTPTPNYVFGYTISVEDFVECALERRNERSPVFMNYLSDSKRTTLFIILLNLMGMLLYRGAVWKAVEMIQVDGEECLCLTLIGDDDYWKFKDTKGRNSKMKMPLRSLLPTIRTLGIERLSVEPGWFKSEGVFMDCSNRSTYPNYLDPAPAALEYVSNLTEDHRYLCR